MIGYADDLVIIMAPNDKDILMNEININLRRLR